MTIVQTFAEHVANMRYEELPPAVVDQAKRCVLDTVGNMAGGRYTAKGDMIVAYAQSVSNAAGATVIGFQSMSVEAAALANACMARVLDLDDGHRFAYGHPACVVIPAALAVGEGATAPVSEVLVAMTAGYDIYARLGAAVNPSSYQECGFDATGICGSVAVAAVAARLHRLNTEQTQHALGIAALHAGGIIEYQHDGTMGKVLCPAWSVSTGIRSAGLAKLGFTGPEEIFEGKKGFFRAFSRKYDAARAVELLAERFEIQRNYFKVYACMRGLHCALDALLELRSKHALNPARVAKVIVRTSSFVARLDQPHPRTLVGAQCSLPFALAVALKHGRVVEDVLMASMNDATVAALEEKIEVVVEERIQEYAKSNPDNWTAVELEILTTDGASRKHWAPVALGEPEHPLSWLQLEEKFLALVSPTPYAADAAAIIRAIKSLDECVTINDFTRALAARVK
jgi:2-methylcitrate dehydratase PrpD